MNVADRKTAEPDHATDQIRELRAAALIRAYELVAELEHECNAQPAPVAMLRALRAELEYVGQSIDREEQARERARTCTAHRCARGELCGCRECSNARRRSPVSR